jgi:hypothetical protein
VCVCVCVLFKHGCFIEIALFCRAVLGKGIVTSEGSIWKTQRTLLSPAFHFTSLERLMTVFDCASVRLM